MANTTIDKLAAILYKDKKRAETALANSKLASANYKKSIAKSHEAIDEASKLKTSEALKKAEKSVEQTRIDSDKLDVAIKELDLAVDSYEITLKELDKLAENTKNKKINLIAKFSYLSVCLK